MMRPLTSVLRALLEGLEDYDLDEEDRAPCWVLGASQEEEEQLAIR